MQGGWIYVDQWSCSHLRNDSWNEYEVHHHLHNGGNESNGRYEIIYKTGIQNRVCDHHFLEHMIIDMAYHTCYYLFYVSCLDLEFSVCVN